MIGNDFNIITGQIELVDQNEFNPALEAVIIEDWLARLQTGQGFSWSSANVGSVWFSALRNSTVGRAGEYRQQITHFSANTSTSVVNLGSFTSIRTAEGEITIEGSVQVEGQTANVTNRQYWLGIQDTTTVTPNNAVLIGFNGLTGAAFWEGRTIQGGTTVTSATATTAVTNLDWVYLKIVINPASTLATFFINGAQLTTLALNGTVLSMFPAFRMQSTSSAAATAYGINQDFYVLRKYFTTPRF